MSHSTSRRGSGSAGVGVMNDTMLQHGHRSQSQSSQSTHLHPGRESNRDVSPSRPQLHFTTASHPSTSGVVGSAASGRRTPEAEEPPLPGISVSVVVRIRPPPEDSMKQPRERRGCEIYRDSGSLAWRWEREQGKVQFFDTAERGFAIGSHEYNFTHIFPTHSSSREIYERIGRNLVQRTFDGFNACIFAYGQTNSGKTHTISGTPEAPGVISHAVLDFFHQIRTGQGRVSLLRVSFLEVYNEHVKDLLQEDQTNSLIIQDDPARGPSVVGLSEHVVSSLEQVLDLKREGEARRMIGRNNVHEHASRSHTVFQLIFESRALEDKEVRVSTLSIVDLAGSELTMHATEPSVPNYLEIMKDQDTIAARTAGLTNEKRNAQQRHLREREGANIRKSLLALSRVVNTLARNPSEHIPYRDSKLTRILRGALGGNSHTAIIATINPWMSATDDKETNATLRFAMTAQRINNFPKQVAVLSEKTLLDRYQSELKDLRTQMLINNQSNEEMLCQLKGEKMENETRLHTQLQARQGDINSLRKKYENLSQFILTAQGVKDRDKDGANGEAHVRADPNQWKKPRRNSFCCLRDKRSISLFKYTKGLRHLPNSLLEAMHGDSSQLAKVPASDVATKEVVFHQRNTIQKLREELGASNSRLRETEETLAQRQREWTQRAQEDKNSLLARLSQMETDHDETKRELRATKETCKERETQIEALRDEVRERDSMLESKSNTIRSLDDNVRELQQNANRLEGEKRNLNTELDKLRQELAQARADISELTLERDDWRAFCEKQSKQLQMDEKDIKALSGEKTGFEKYFREKREQRNFLRRYINEKQGKGPETKPWLRYAPAEGGTLLHPYQGLTAPSPRSTSVPGRSVSGSSNAPEKHYGQGVANTATHRTTTTTTTVRPPICIHVAEDAPLLAVGDSRSATPSPRAPSPGSSHHVSVPSGHHQMAMAL